ncbi:MAG TPA: hypothetical protein VGD48_06970 [Kutzneria sp.]
MVPLQGRRRRHVAWLAAAAVVVGVLVVALVEPSVGPGGDGPESKIGSAVAAEALSQAASKTGDVVLQPGQFLYVRNQAFSGGSGDDGNELLREIGEGLDSGLIPADLRKAVFQALAYLPNLEVTDKAEDFDGRTGEGFGIVHDSQLEEVVIATATGQYLGSRTADRQGLKAGTQLWSSSLTTKVVDAMGRR